jgi:uncharacterized repeat protein (TIGR01451 family)
MKRVYLVAAVVVFGAGLIGWAALALGQPGRGSLGTDPPPSAAPQAAFPDLPPIPKGADLPPPPQPSPAPARAADSAPPLRIGDTLPPIPDPPPPTRSTSAFGQRPAGPSAVGADPYAIPPLPPLPPPPGGQAQDAVKQAGWPGSGDTSSPPNRKRDTATKGKGPVGDPSWTADGAGTPGRIVPAPATKEEAGDAVSSRQEPAVRMEWAGPAVAKIGVPADYVLNVQNLCAIPVQQVLVRVRLPEGLRAAGTEPKGIVEGNVLVWEVGGLQPRQERALQMRLVADKRGDMMPQAWVTFTGSAVTRIKVRQPRLAMKLKGPDKLNVGDPATLMLTITNPGDGSADTVRVRALLSEGLEHARGQKVEFEIGNLAAGESREVVLSCATRSGGTQHCEVIAEAEGGVAVRETAAMTVLAPRVVLRASGPGLRYLGRKAIYTFKVVNSSDMPASNVSVADVVPEGLKVLGATHGGRFEPTTHTVTWFIGEVPAGQAREVQLEVQAVGCGDHRHKVSVSGARGVRAEAETATHVEGVSALMVSLADPDTAIEVGSETIYEVRLSNTGSKPETDIRLMATIPDRMEFRSASGGECRLNGEKLVFAPLANLPPQGEAVYRIRVKGMQTGTVRFKVQVTSASLTEPVIKMEATRIYSDTPGN